MAETGLALIVPDTSPRNVGIAGEDDSDFLGSGAGFYVNATRPPWSAHYQMYDYVSKELPALVESVLPIDPVRRGICGHSMGGHGALVIALRNPGRYRSVSALAPISNPAASPGGRAAFSAYLGEEGPQWRQYDASLLVREKPLDLEIRIDLGSADPFRDEELKVEQFLAACRESGQKASFNLREATITAISLSAASSRPTSAITPRPWWLKSRADRQGQGSAISLQKVANGSTRVRLDR